MFFGVTAWLNVCLGNLVVSPYFVDRVFTVSCE